MHEIHLLSENMHHDLYSFEAFIRSIVKNICVQLDMKCTIWSVNLVDVYICPTTKLISHTFQIGYCSLGIPLGRDLANHIKSQIENKLPEMVNMTLRDSKKGLSVSQPFHWKLALKMYQESNDLEVSNNYCDIQQLAHLLREFENNNLKVETETDGSLIVKRIAKTLWKRRIGIKSKDSN